jgi:hypothetical protein
MGVLGAKFESGRIRGPNLSLFVKGSPGVPFEEGLAKADDEDRVLIPSVKLSKFCVPPLESRRTFPGYDLIKQGLPCWSGTMTAYVEPGKKLGKRVEAADQVSETRWIFSVPEEHIGKKNVILVAEHPDYVLEVEGINRVVHAKVVDIIENFPARDGYYLGDPKHDIPTGKPIKRPWEGDFEGRERFLHRIDKRAGPVLRDFYYTISEYNFDVVDLSMSPAKRCGFFAELPTKIDLLIASLMVVAGYSKGSEAFNRLREELGVFEEYARYHKRH